MQGGWRRNRVLILEQKRNRGEAYCRYKYLLSKIEEKCTCTPLKSPCKIHMLVSNAFMASL